jgi:hypothetical protein
VHPTTLRNMARAAIDGVEVLQVDFAPTLAALLGVPTPYASIGRVSRGLWHLRGCSSNGDARTCRQRYAATLQANAWQVRLAMLLKMALRCRLLCRCIF